MTQTDKGSSAAANLPLRHTRTTKREELRTRLLSTAIELFLRVGFDETTITEISDRAGTSRRTFFRYFSSKDELVFDWLLRQGQTVAEQVAARERNVPPLAAVREAMIDLARQWDNNRTSATSLTRIVMRTPTLNRRLEAETARWEASLIDIVQGEAPLNIEQEFALRIQMSAAAGAFLGAMRRWAEAGHRGALQVWVETAFHALESGFSQLAKGSSSRNRRR